MNKARHAGAVLLLLIAGFGELVRGQNAAATPEASSSGTTPAKPFQRVAVICHELDFIRREMGKPAVERHPLQVSDAAPREVYFQALTLFRKADRLAFEHTRERVEEPPVPSGTIGPHNVYQMLGLALERIRRVKEALGITEKAEVPALVPDVQPSMVFSAIVDANREINLLLDRRFSPGDVFQQVTVAIANAARLLDRAGEKSTPPEGPDFERRKRPTDVYRRLLECYEQVRRLGEISKEPMLRLDPTKEVIENAGPSDVYDIASLLVSELIHLRGLRSDSGQPRETYNPGRKLPAHVFQRAGILQEQLSSLIEHAEQNPGWLSKQNGTPPANP